VKGVGIHKFLKIQNIFLEDGFAGEKSPAIFFHVFSTRFPLILKMEEGRKIE